jgi:hypothetical protein
LIVSGVPARAPFTSTTSPESGAKSSLTAFTDSTVPNTSCAASFRPGAGSSTYTTSPSCFCA